MRGRWGRSAGIGKMALSRSRGNPRWDVTDAVEPDSRGKASGVPEKLARAAAWGLNAYGPLNLWMIRQESAGVQVGLIPSRSAFRLPTLAGARLWSVCGEGAALRVVAADESKIWQAAGDGAEWRQLADAKNAQWLRTFTMRGCWAEWLEPGYGVRRLRLQ